MTLHLVHVLDGAAAHGVLQRADSCIRRRAQAPFDTKVVMALPRASDPNPAVQIVVRNAHLMQGSAAIVHPMQASVDPRDLVLPVEPIDNGSMDCFRG